MVEIHPDKFVDTQLKLSDIAEELEYIQLDTARIVNPRWQIKMTDKYIFVAARDELLQYDRKGKFIQTIGSKGQGPGEFTSCTNIALDMEGERIFVKDWSQILVYTFDGKFLSKMEIPLEGMVGSASRNQVGRCLGSACRTGRRCQSGSGDCGVIIGSILQAVCGRL